MNEVKNKLACKECGLIINKPAIDYKHHFACPRCDASIYKYGQGYTLIIALACTSIFLFFPTVFLPLLTIKVFDMEQSTSLAQAAIVFLGDGYVLLSLFIVLIGIVIPLWMLVLILLILIPLKQNKSAKSISHYFRWYESLHEWQMAEVALVSIFIAIIKLYKMAELQLQPGLYFFVLFLIMMFVTMHLFNPYDIWSKENAK